MEMAVIQRMEGIVRIEYEVLEELLGKGKEDENV